MAMRRIGDVDVLVINTGQTLLALPPLCEHMVAPLTTGNYAACFDAGKPACNRYRGLASAVGRTAGGVAGHGDAGYLTRTVGDEVYVDVDARVPLVDFEHVTCAPRATHGEAPCLLVTLWNRGFTNDAVRVKSADGERRNG